MCAPHYNTWPEAGAVAWDRSCRLWLSALTRPLLAVVYYTLENQVFSGIFLYSGHGYILGLFSCRTREIVLYSKLCNLVSVFAIFCRHETLCACVPFRHFALIYARQFYILNFAATSNFTKITGHTHIYMHTTH